MFNNISYKKNGYTLIEVIIAAAIFSMLIMVAMAVFGANSSLQLRSETIREASQNAKFIMEAIARDIRLSDKIVILNASTSPRCTSIHSAICRGIEITQGNDKIFYRYVTTTNGGAITYQSTGADIVPETILNSDNVTITNFTLTGDDSKAIDQQPIIKISIDFKAVTGQKTIETQTQHVETTVTTRNYPSFYSKFTTDEN